MKNINCIKCNKYRKCTTLKNIKSYIFDKTLFISITCDRCGRKDEKIFKEEGLVELLEFLDLINNMKE